MAEAFPLKGPGSPVVPITMKEQQTAGYGMNPEHVLLLLLETHSLLVTAVSLKSDLHYALNTRTNTQAHADHTNMLSSDQQLQL